MRIEVNDQAPRFVPVKSLRFCCSMCGTVLVEWTPVVKLGMRRGYFDKLGKSGQKLPKVRLECPNGHHKFPRWSFVDMRNLKGAI